MSFKVIEIILVFTFVTSSLGLNLQQLSDDCLQGNILKEAQDLTCSTQRGVRIQTSQRSGQTFYCVSYEKKTGNKSEFEILSFDLLNDDYNLKFTGANAFNEDPKNPQFKLYDLRTKRTYKGKFAFSTENSSFDVKNIYIKDEKQICVNDKNVQTWPKMLAPPHTTAQYDDYFDERTTRRSQRTTTTRSTTERYRITTIGATVGTVESCGEIKVKESLSVDLPTSPGQFPWVVAIYRYREDAHESYKCAGTIVDKRNIVTSVNCLLEDGLLLKPGDLRVYVSPFSLMAKIQNYKIFEIAEILTHEEFNTQLENNIAMVKLTRDIDFNNYVQPICLPRQTYTPKGKIGKVAGFGKSSIACDATSQILTAAEYTIGNSTDYQAFAAENTSGNSKISDLGSGLFVNESNHWTLVGIMSKRTQASVDRPQMFEFVNVAKFFNWIESFNKPTLPY